MIRTDLRFEEGLQRYDEATDSAFDRVHEMGLGLPRRPQQGGEFVDLPDFPWSNVREMTPGEVGQWLDVFTGWFAYAQGQLQAAESRWTAAEKKKEFAWSRLRDSKVGTVADKDNRTRTDARYVQVSAEATHWETVVRLLRGLVEGLKRDCDTLSRRVTILDQQLGVEGRAQGVSRKNIRDNTERQRQSVLTRFQRRR